MRRQLNIVVWVLCVCLILLYPFTTASKSGSARRRAQIIQQPDFANTAKWELLPIQFAATFDFLDPAEKLWRCGYGTIFAYRDALNSNPPLMGTELIPYRNNPIEPIYRTWEAEAGSTFRQLKTSQGWHTIKGEGPLIKRINQQKTQAELSISDPESDVGAKVLTPCICRQLPHTDTDTTEEEKEPDFPFALGRTQPTIGL